jgi:dipeptidyl aminopeptidase/acylaminoacyl peptidase
VQAKEGATLRLVQTVERLVTVELGRAAQAFAFGSDGRTVAFLADVVPGKQGNLHLGAPGKKDVVLAREVGEFRWASAAPRLAWLEKHDPRVRSGVLGAGGRDLAPRVIAQNVSDVEISPDGRHVAFLQHTTRGGYSVDLGLARLDAPAAEKATPIAQGAFGFSFSPDGKWLYFRTRCVRNGEACDLERVPAEGPAPGGKPEVVAQGVKSFEFDPRDPGRLLVTWQRMDLVALDLAVWEAGKLTRVDTAILPGSAAFLGPDSRRVAYVVAHPKRAGVYVAELPR